jgi:hypothetical protein
MFSKRITKDLMNHKCQEDGYTVKDKDDSCGISRVTWNENIRESRNKRQKEKILREKYKNSNPKTDKIICENWQFEQEK